MVILSRLHTVMLFTLIDMPFQANHERK